MRKVYKVSVVLAATATYLALLHYTARSGQPYYLLGIGVVGLAAWLLGSIHGMLVALALAPLTKMAYGNTSMAREFLEVAASIPYLAMQVWAAIGLGILGKRKSTIAKSEVQLADDNQRLKDALYKVKELGGVHGYCGSCKKIKADSGEWKSPDVFLMENTKMEFSHAFCPDCAEEYKKANAKLAD